MDLVDENLSALRAAFENKMRGNARPVEAERLLKALEDGHFTFAQERWHSASAALAETPSSFPAEILARPHEDGRGFAPFPGISALNDLGLSIALDRVILSKAASIIKESTTPVAINIAAQSVESAEFWNWVKTSMDPANASKIIFEITEDHTADKVCLQSMQDLKRLGYRFALDDFTSGEEELKRIKNLSSIVDFVKIHGKTIEMALSGHPGELADVVGTIRSLVPNAPIIGEWIKTVEQAKNMKEEFGIEGAQGRELPKTAAEFQEQMQLILQPAVPHVEARSQPSI